MTEMGGFRVIVFTLTLSPLQCVKTVKNNLNAMFSYFLMYFYAFKNSHHHYSVIHYGDRVHWSETSSYLKSRKECKRSQFHGIDGVAQVSITVAFRPLDVLVKRDRTVIIIEDVLNLEQCLIFAADNSIKRTNGHTMAFRRPLE